MYFYATATLGLEDIVAREIEGLTGTRCEVDINKVFFSGDLELIPKLNYLSRCANRIFILLLRERFEDINDIYSHSRSISLSDYVEPDQTFAVRATRHGFHDFTSLDVARVVGQAIIDSYLDERGSRLKVNLENPDVEVQALVRDDELILGFNTSGEALAKRGYRVYQHPAPIKPTIACCLLILSGWRPSSSLLDPMCGGGTIPIEAALMARNIPPGSFRRNFAFEKFRFLDPSLFLEVKEEASVHVNTEKYEITGIEKYKNHVNGAIMNAKSAGVIDTVKIIQADATKWDYKPKPEFIVTNPPYGLRIASKRATLRLYRGFSERVKELEGTKMVLIVGNNWFEEIFPLEPTEKREILYGNLRCFVLKYVI
ncbi:MAG: class I SAM-dependent RNA methyltransferase [Thermoproteota archaeon]|nr:MAG: class I SAM-dependent RNA methyltransferase [Candidatus Korarchaeota archaeon]RLG54119.1 MAG: class I SAM-dependent RNA methyltransferase [Candidatus Korarchaeota archaeon]